MCKLNKAIYGLKQPLRAWYSRINQHFKDMGFGKSESEHTLYRRQGKGGEMLVISLYVDDIVYTSSSFEMLDEFKKEMMQTFSMTDLGEMGLFLGLEVKQRRDGIFLCQRSYIMNLLRDLK